MANTYEPVSERTMGTFRIDQEDPLVHRILHADLQSLQSDYKPEQLFHRAFPFRLPIVLLVVSFAQKGPCNVQQYKPILEFWLDKGARIDARDMLGQTALQYAAGHTNPVLLLAEVLLQRGANVNMQCRSGVTPLLNCTHIGEVCLLTTLAWSIQGCSSSLLADIPRMPDPVFLVWGYSCLSCSAMLRGQVWTGNQVILFTA